MQWQAVAGRQAIRLAAISLVFGAESILAASASFPEGDGSLSSQGMPNIPEPMLFDLVRPLGARKGELEVNSLFEHGLRHPGTEWAPEIEYAFADGYAIEFEFPSENTQLVEYKVALQGTIGTLRNNTMVHGWQVIGIRERETGHYSADLLYLNGSELPGRWSTFNMLGMRRTVFGSEGHNIGLVNNALFYDYSQRLTFGMELNHEIHAGFDWRTRIIPQIHYDFSTNLTVQFGGGPSWLETGRSPQWSVDWRLIYAW